MTFLGIFFFILGILFVAIPTVHQWIDKSEILIPFVFALPGFLFLTAGLGIFLFKAFKPSQHD